MEFSDATGTRTRTARWGIVLITGA